MDSSFLKRQGTAKDEVVWSGHCWNMNMELMTLHISRYDFNSLIFHCLVLSGRFYACVPGWWSEADPGVRVFGGVHQNTVTIINKDIYIYKYTIWRWYMNMMNLYYSNVMQCPWYLNDVHVFKAFFLPSLYTNVTCFGSTLDLKCHGGFEPWLSDIKWINMIFIFRGSTPEGN